MTIELKKKIEQLERDVNNRISKNHESLKEELRNNNATLKREIRDEFALVIEGMKEKQDLVDEKLDVIMQLLGNNKTKEQRSPRNSESPPRDYAKGAQYHPVIMYPPRAKIELT